MAWIYRRNGSGFWWIGTRANGRLICKSTGETTEEKANEALATLEAMEKAKRANRLNRELFEALTGAQIEAKSLFDCLDTWVKETTNPNTRRNYENFSKQFKLAIPTNPLVAEVTHEQVKAFLTGVRAERAATTANQALKEAKVFFGRFSQSLRRNPVAGIKAYKKDTTAVTRKAFSLEQIRNIYAMASKFWRCASAIAFYTGLRLSDVATLRVGYFDFKGNRLEIEHTRKTGARISVQLPAALVAMVREEIQPGAKAADYIWPDEAKHVEDGNVTNLSDQFATILVNAGIREKSKSAGNGKSGKRIVNPYTFHSLRHGFISALANAGVNQQTVKKLVGHASDRINDAYTHIGQETMDRAVASLPDITKAEVTK